MSDIALTVSILALVAVVGLFIGNVKFRGVGLGIGGVLFGGIIVGHFVSQAGMTLSSDMLHVIQEFGLILFVYTIGIQVGPGFFASLRVSGLRLNLFAVLIVIIGGLVTAILHKLFDIPLPVVLGIFSGAVTNTPALGAGQQILRDLADDRQEIEAALEIFLITQHRDRRGVVLVDAGDRCRIEILANQPLRRRGLLALENKRGAGAGQCVIEIALRRNDLILKTG